MKFVIDNEVSKGNYGGANHGEAFFGLNKVYIYENENIKISNPLSGGGNLTPFIIVFISLKFVVPAQ